MEEIAETISGDLNYSPDVPLSEFIAEMGGELDVVDFWETDAKHGALTAKPDGSFRINLAAHTSARRDRFTVAHELGHLFIHYFRIFDEHDDHECFVATREGSNQVEWEANWFASAFLMPKEAFEKAFQSSNGNLYEVADVFQVSEEAASIRAKNLQLIA